MNTQMMWFDCLCLALCCLVLAITCRRYSRIIKVKEKTAAVIASLARLSEDLYRNDSYTHEEIVLYRQLKKAGYFSAPTHVVLIRAVENIVRQDRLVSGTSVIFRHQHGKDFDRSRFLLDAFDWSDTPEGFRFWADVYHAIAENEKKPDKDTETPAKGPDDV